MPAGITKTLTAEQLSTRGKLAIATRQRGADDPVTVALRTEFDAGRLAQKLAALAPRLTDGQRATLRALIEAP